MKSERWQQPRLSTQVSFKPARVLTAKCTYYGTFFTSQKKKTGGMKIVCFAIVQI